MGYGSIHFRIDELLKERGISKNKLCKDLDIARTKLNHYCSNKNVRFDMRFICKLCSYFQIEVGELMVYEPEPNEENE